MSVKIKKSFNMKSLLRLFFFFSPSKLVCYPCFMTKCSFLMLILILDTKSKTLLWETLCNVCLAKSSARLPCLVSLIGILTETAWIGSTPLWSCKHHFFGNGTMRVSCQVPEHPALSWLMESNPSFGTTITVEALPVCLWLWVQWGISKSD